MSTIVASAAFSDAHPLIAKLESIFTLSEDEKSAILTMPVQVADLRADQDIVRAGDSPSRSCVILKGITATYVTTPKGKRQIVAFGVVGDTPDVQSLLLDVLDCSVGTLTPCRLAFIQHSVLKDICMRFPRIGAALWRSTLVEGAIFRQWVTNIGQREAYSRMAHLFCEIMTRKRAVGLTQNNSCKLPISQNELADALGMSSIHVNRILQALRADGRIVLEGGVLTIPDWEQLVAVAEFDATYLHLRDSRAAA